MTLIDITRTVQDAPIYPGSSPVHIERVSDMATGAVFNASMITAGSHMGTHADALSHFLGHSMVSIDKMPLEAYYGPCRVLTTPPDTLITRAMIAGKTENTQRLVLHTGGQGYLSKEAAHYIAEQGIRLLATDAWSVAPLNNEVAVHTILLEASIAIVENLTLDHVPDGDYLIAAFPVKYGGCDGAPVRAVLIAE